MMSRTLKTLGIPVALTAMFATGVVIGAQQASRREPQFENARVKSWKSVIAPNQPLSLHRHDHSRAIIALTDGTLDLVDGQGKTMKQMVWEKGKAYWYGPDEPGTQHADLNRTDKMIEVIVVELQD